MLRLRWFFPILCFLCLWPVLVARAAEYDLVIRNGRVVDGTGNPAYFADVAVKEGRIAQVGHVTGSGATEVDAKGLVIAPGFIDVHTHAENVLSLPRAENFARMGVTSIVIGNCGGSELDLGAFFRELETRRASVNVASLIGHNTVRSHVMGGSFDRAPTPDELEQMKALVEQGMKDGAAGLSTGLIYLPGAFSKTEEIIELAKVASRYDGIYTTHQRNEGLGIKESLEEVFRIAREAHIRTEVSHIKLSGKPAWGHADEILGMIDSARAEGLDITQDQYVYTASSTGISQLIPSSAREGGRDRFRERMADPTQKARVVAEMREAAIKRGQNGYSYAVIASYRADRSLNGKSILEAAKLKRGSDSLDDQIEMILEIEDKGGASGVFHGMSEEDLQRFLRHPNTMLASDSGIHVPGADVPHPRGYGNNARALGRYVRDLRVLRLEDAVRKCSSLPATVFHLRDRGFLRAGCWADIVLIDMEKVQDVATYADPHRYATGIPYVFVNGVAVIKNGEHTGALPGGPLRHRAGD